MENNKKRARINATPKNALSKSLVDSTSTDRVEKINASIVEVPLVQSAPEYDFVLSNGKFDWDGYENSNNTKLQINPHIKTTSHKHLVYSNEKNAQEMYDLINNAALSTYDISELIEGSIITGKLHSMTEKWATVDVDYRELLYIDVAKEDRNVIGQYVPGDEVSVKVLESKDREFKLASITEGNKQKTFIQLRAAAETGNTAFMGTVESMIPGGGYIVKVQGIDCFMPGSLAGINKLADFNSIVGKDIYVVPDSFSERKGTIVVSHRAYLQAMIPNMLIDLGNNLDVVQTGYVTGSAKFGVFCEFNDCLTGMIHINDLSEKWAAKHKSGNITPGEPVEFKIKQVVSDKKIILTQVEAKPEIIDNSWEEFTKDLTLPSIVDGTVRSVKDYGVFIELHGTVVGMAHVSSFAKGFDIKDTFIKGQSVKVEVTKIDNDTNKVFLKVVDA
jgi:ribosomal protein S1